MPDMANPPGINAIAIIRASTKPFGLSMFMDWSIVMSKGLSTPANPKHFYTAAAILHLG